MAAHWHTHTYTYTHAWFQVPVSVPHMAQKILPNDAPRIEHEVDFSVNYYLCLFSVDFVQWTTAISQLIVMQCQSLMSLSANGNANTIRTKQSIELDATIATSSLNTLFGSRLDKPSAGHHNCVELEKQPDDVRETSSAVLYSEHSRDRQLKLGIHSKYLVFYAVRSSNIERVWR